jgi:1,4-dihydroxy-2-naphthoyl-CoA hydrolase
MWGVAMSERAPIDYRPAVGNEPGNFHEMSDGNDNSTRPLVDALTASGEQLLPGHMGLEVVELAPGVGRMRCRIQEFHKAPNGFLHAGSVVTLADTAAGYGCVASLPEGATGFTTIEIKINFLGTALEGVLLAEAKMVHGGRTTQVWDVEVTSEESGKSIALFRCTQFILYPKA